MLQIIICLAVVVHSSVSQNAPGCHEDVPSNGPAEPCGVANINNVECNELGCCWVENECVLWKEETSIFQKGLKPSDSPVQTHAGFNIVRCSAQTEAISGGWDWAFSVDDAEVCQIYSSRWHIYRTQGSWTNDAAVDTFEQLTWEKRPRDVYEDFGSKYSALENLYLGCFPSIDSLLPGNVVDINYHLWTWNSNTVEQCITSCRAEGYNIAGVRAGNQCYCTNRMMRRMDAVADSVCNVPCPGDALQTCGAASDYNSVYFVAPNHRFAGCYNDTTGIHQWDEWTASAGKTADECVEQCSLREDISQRQYYHHYAFVANNGDCFCADQKTIVENSLVTEPGACMGRCQGVYASDPTQYCGNPGVAAAYSTFHNLPQRPNWSHTPYDWHRPLMRRMRFMEADNVAIADSTMTGIPTNIFTLFPELQTVLSPRLILHASEAVLAPFEAQRCGAECYSECGEIWYEEKIEDNRDSVNIYAWHINLKDIFGRVADNVRRVYVYAQIVVIDDDLHFPFSLTVRARQIVLDRSKSHYLTVDRNTPVLVEDYFDDNDKSPAASNLFQKMVHGCARILMSTGQQTHMTTAFEMLDDVIQDFQYDKEQASFKTAVRLTRSEFTGMVRAGIRHVPFFTKSYFQGKLMVHHVELKKWSDLYTSILNTAITIDELLRFTEDMLDIFVNTNIQQWKTMYEAQLVALKISNATYYAIYHNFSVSRDNLDTAKAAFEQGLNDYQDAQKKSSFRGFIRGAAKMVVGVLTYNPKMIASGLGDFISTLDNLAETMEYLTRGMEKVEAMMTKLDYLMSILEDIIENGDLEEIAGDVELIAQLRVMLVGWQNMKHNSIAILSSSEARQIGGSQDYLTAILDTCNWGYALTDTMIEMAENYRRLMLIKTMLQNKIEMQERYKEYIEECRNNNADRYHLVARMVEMQYDIRNDVNELLMDFCDLYYYEHQVHCSPGSRPTFDGSLTLLLSRLASAIADGLWGSGVPGNMFRPISITDDNTEPDCNDITECPIKVFRETRMLRFTVPQDHPDFIDIDRYRIGKIVVDVIGAKSSGTPNNRLKLDIESTSPFGVRYATNWHYFVTRALRVVYEYDVEDGTVTWEANLYLPEASSNIYHRSPFSTWVIRVSSVSDHIDISDVTHVRIVFEGTGVSNTPKDKVPEIAA